MSLKNTLILSVLLMGTVVACNEAPSSESTESVAAAEASQKMSSAQMASKMTMAENANRPQIGDIVPSNLVCMVNNQYMGVKQLVVKFEGKTYYGCCEMCQKRIPADPKVRVGIDPYSQEKVNKAEAVIAVTGKRGAVSYFENKENYKKYLEAIRN